ncbi:MAG: hypothetical protein ACTSPA_07105 [Promethearchaeota archaeon]
MENEILLQQISRLIIQNKKKIVNERDIINLCSDEEEYKRIIPILVQNFKLIGFSLIRTTFQGKRFFVLTTPGKDDIISPSMYGTLGLIIALYNDVGREIELSIIKQIFKELWDEVEELITHNYLQITQDKGTDKISITPIGKAAFKNVLKGLNLPKILSFQNLDEKTKPIEKVLKKTVKKKTTKKKAKKKKTTKKKATKKKTTKKKGTKKKTTKKKATKKKTTKKKATKKKTTKKKTSKKKTTKKK